MNKCTDGVTLEELLLTGKALLGLRGAEDEDADDADDTDSDEDGEDEDGDDGDESDDDEDEDGEGDPADKSKSKKKDSAKSESERKIDNLTEDRNRQFHKRKAAEQKVKDLTEKVATLEKDGTKDEDLRAKLTKAEEDQEKLTTANVKLALENAFLRDNTYDWANPADAFKLLDLSDVEEDGSGLKAALDKLATDKKYLLKGAAKRPARKTGETPGTGKKKQQSAADREKFLRERYPQLG
jgi:hypothetical protein